MKLINDIVWFQFCIEDTHMLSGGSVCSFLEKIANYKSGLKVVISNAEGAFSSDFIKIREWSSLNDFIGGILDVKQFDWADIFIGQNDIENDINLERAEVAFNFFDLVVSLVDSSYIYVYTKDINIINILSAEYPKGELKSGNFSSLDFMY